MTDYSPHQRKIINRYYDHKDTIMLTKLADMVSELYLADTDKKREQLWKRVETAMKNLKIPPATSAHIMEKKSPELLAGHLRDWQYGTK